MIRILTQCYQLCLKENWTYDIKYNGSKITPLLFCMPIIFIGWKDVLKLYLLPTLRKPISIYFTLYSSHVKINKHTTGQTNMMLHNRLCMQAKNNCVDKRHINMKNTIRKLIPDLSVGIKYTNNQHSILQVYGQRTLYIRRKYYSTTG